MIFFEDAKGRAFSKLEASVYELPYVYTDAVVLEVLPADILAHENFDILVYTKSLQISFPSKC